MPSSRTPASDLTSTPPSRPTTIHSDHRITASRALLSGTVTSRHRPGGMVRPRHRRGLNRAANLSTAGGSFSSIIESYPHRRAPTTSGACGQLQRRGSLVDMAVPVLPTTTYGTRADPPGVQHDTLPCGFISIPRRDLRRRRLGTTISSSDRRRRPRSSAVRATSSSAGIGVLTIGIILPLLAPEFAGSHGLMVAADGVVQHLQKVV